MARPRFAKLPPERRREILDVAGKQFAEHGFHGASFNGILGAAGISKGAAYYYFDDKADLFATVVEDAWEIASTGIDFDPTGLTPGTWWPALEALYRCQIASFRDRPWLWLAAKAAGPAMSDPEVGAVLAARLAPMMALLRSIPERAQALGVVRTDLPIALVTAMVASLDAAIDAWFLANPAATDDPDVVGAAFASIRAVAEGEPRAAPVGDDTEVW
jgi:AcrR family transcriptional regulator